MCLPHARGNEVAEHERLSQRRAIRAFFAALHSPWQRGINELQRQYRPTRTDVTGYSQHELDVSAQRLNR